MNSFLKRLSTSLTLAIALLFPFLSQAADDPAKALQSEFQAAKDSLAVGDLVEEGAELIALAAPENRRED